MKKQYSKQYENTVKNYKKSNKKLKPSEWIVIALMAFWTLASVFGTIAFVRQNSSSVDMLSASAATSTKTETDNSVTYEIESQGLAGLSLQSSNYEYLSNPFLIFEFVPKVTLYTNGTLSSIAIDWEDYDEGRFTDRQYIYSTFADMQTVSANPKFYNGLAGGYYTTYINLRFYTNMTAETLEFLPLDIIPLTVNYKLYDTEKLTLEYEFSNDFIFYIDFDYSSLFAGSGLIIDTLYSPSIDEQNGGFTLGQPYYEFVTVNIDYPTYSVELENAYLQGVDEQNQYWQNQVNNAFNNGKTQGIDIGYTQGINDANTYSFSGLLGAIIDVPINAFRNMFDFNFLGINMAQFGMSVLSLCAVVVVVKLFI